MSNFFAGLVVVMSTLTGTAVFAAPTVPAKTAQLEKFAATMPTDSALTLRTPDRVLFRVHRQRPDADGDCADGGDHDYNVAAPQTAPQAAPGNLRAVRTIR